MMWNSFQGYLLKITTFNQSQNPSSEPIIFSSIFTLNFPYSKCHGTAHVHPHKQSVAASS